jgi:riboflavin kinase / FMN adenylyltransferase
VVLPFDNAFAAMTAQAFINEVLVRALGARYVLVGDDFRFGAQRQGDYVLLDAEGSRQGFDVARMMSYEVHGLRVSSSAVRDALAEGRMEDAGALLGRPYAISGHVVHGAKLGRELGASRAGAGDGFRTLNLRFSHWKPAASGIFAVQVHGLDPTTGAAPLPGVANLGVRPSLDPKDVNGGRVLLETHCLDWPAHLREHLRHGPVPGEAYSKIIRVELLHKLHDELRYDSLDALTQGIARDCDDARAYFAHLASHAAVRRQTTRDRI